VLQTDIAGSRLGDLHPFSPPLLQALRQGTRAAHDRIEVIPGLACLLSEQLTAGAYIAALRALYQFQGAMHRRLPPLLRDITGLAWPDPAVLSALHDDLVWFGASTPRPIAGPRVVTDSCTALGALYVVEGSALGGRVIGRAIARSLSVAPGRGGSFFCGRTADDARERWRLFCDVLASEGDRLDAPGQGRVVAGAVASFAYLEARLGGCQVAGGSGDANLPVRTAASGTPRPDGLAVPNVN
jgi:heme oxygenase